MAVPSLPTHGSMSWYGWAQGVQDEVVAGRLRSGLPTVMAIGDSITANNGGLIDTTSLRPQYADIVDTSWMLWAHILSGARFLWSGTAATGGYTTQQIHDVHLPTALAVKPTYCVVLAGQNSQSDLNGLVAIWEALVAAGITPILCTLPAAGTGSALWKINQFIARYAIKHGLPLVDFHAATVDPATGLYKAGYSGDGTHPNFEGAHAMGQALADVMVKVVPRSYLTGLLADNNAVSDLQVGNPLMLTDDGAGVPTNWAKLNTVTTALGTNASVAGRTFTITRGAANGVVAAFPPNIVPGHRYLIAFRLGADPKYPNGGWKFSLVDGTTGQQDIGANLWHPVPIETGAIAFEWTAPSVLAHPGHRFDLTVTDAAGANMTIGQFTMRDLTALGLE